MANKPIKKNRVGEQFTNRGGCSFIIVEYNKCSDVVVEFQDKHKARVRTNYQACQRGSVKNPYYPSVHGVGMLGQVDGKTPIISENGKVVREYMVWNNMITRCYSECDLKRKPTYRDAKVCDRWLIYSNFLEDIEYIKGYTYWLNHPNEGVSLDKDLLGNGSKIYSLNTCMFVSASENSIDANNRRWHMDNPHNPQYADDEEDEPQEQEQDEEQDKE